MTEAKDIVNGLPYVIGTNTIAVLSRYDRSSFNADYAIGNVPWMSAARDDNPYSRVTTPFQRERVDQSSTAGEQSLTNWWIRSATSWHRGAGISFYDGDDTDLFRFSDSHNVDVWTVGEVKLLPEAERKHTTSASSPVSAGIGAYFISGGKVYALELDGDVVEVSAFTSTTAVPQRLASDGADCFVGADDGVYVIKPDYSVAKWYTSPASADWTVQAMGFVKDRLIVCAETADTKPMWVFELARNPSGAPVAVSTATHGIWSYDSTTLDFVAVTETTGAILVGLTTGVRSRVLSFSVDQSAGGLGALLEPINVAEFPSGEVLQTLGSYLNTYVVAGTNRGLRVGTETSNGQGFTYGPLTIEDSIVGLAFDGEFVYATRAVSKGGTFGLWRVHLGTEVEDKYAYASDLSTSGSAVTGLCLHGTTGRMVISSGNGVYLEHATKKAATGYLESGAVRFGTQERKQPVTLSTLATQEFGTVDITVSNLEGQTSVASRTGDNALITVPLSADVRPSSQLSVRLDFARGGTTDPGPIFQEWQLRALPAPQRSRTITIPLMCYLEERDASGNVRVSDPWLRLKALELIEQTGGSVLFQDFTTGDERICVIRGVQFDQKSPPNFKEGFGGIVTVQLQTVDSEVY